MDSYFVIRKRIIFVVIAIITFASTLNADVTLPNIIGSNMVLQQDTLVKIWGWANPGESIIIQTSWLDKSDPEYKTIANENGKWLLKIKTPKAGGPYNVSIKGDNFIELNNILIGEVWLCSGQSNMDMPMKGWKNQPIEGAPNDIANSANKSIRLFIVDKKLANSPLDTIGGQWVECTPETLKDFSAAGYYFASKLNAETKYPVGAIHSAWGGTVAQAWMRIDYLSTDDYLMPLVDWYYNTNRDWEKACQVAEQNNQPKPSKPGGINSANEPSALYNGMIAPINNLTIKGVIWYQGESNVGNSFLYRKMFPKLIQNWRCDFHNNKMPFYFVQIASFSEHKPGQQVTPYRGTPRDHGWAHLREAQFMTCSMKNTGMAVTIDIGQTNNIHPANKKEVGRRLALWALTKDYGMDLDYSGPLYAGYRIEGDKIRIYFDYAEDGLVFRDGVAKGFAIAGHNQHFVWADAVIDGSTVLVFSNQIKEPKSVRYAWDVDPEICLFNKANLPASPFRTDDWKEVVNP